MIFALFFQAFHPKFSDQAHMELIQSTRITYSGMPMRPVRLDQHLPRQNSAGNFPKAP